MPPPPPPQIRKPVIVNVHGSLKKRIAPLPPGGCSSLYGTLPSTLHSRTTSDPMVPAQPAYLTLCHHKRSPSSDSSSSKSIQHSIPAAAQDPKSLLKRPANPPPPAPSPSNRLSNGRSNESISSISSADHLHNNPVPPPRKVS